MTRSTWSVVTTALAALLSAATLLPATATPVAAADPLAGAPAVGECRTYTAEDRAGWTEDSPAVDCAARHTGLVVAVEIAPDKYQLAGKPNAQLIAFAGETCGPAWKRASGATHAQRHMMAYTFSWFVPTKAQLALGARWIRCDINIWSNDGLGPLPTSPIPFIDGYLDRGDRRCITGKGFFTSCANSHKWISRGIVTAPKGAYSTDRQDAVARRRCPSTLQRSDTRFLWDRVSEASWKAGERHIVCYGNGR